MAPVRAPHEAPGDESPRAERYVRQLVGAFERCGRDLVDDVLVLLGITPPAGAEYAGGMECGDGGVVRLCARLCFEPILCLESFFGAE